MEIFGSLCTKLSNSDHFLWFIFILIHGATKSINAFFRTEESYLKPLDFETRYSFELRKDTRIKIGLDWLIE